MAFTTSGLKEFLDGFKANFTSMVGTMVAIDASSNYIDAANIEFGSISNGEMDITTAAVFDVGAGVEVSSIALYTGQVQSTGDMTQETELAKVTFAQGTYVFTNPGTLTVNSFEISLVNE